ncbi:hypothetical protein GGI21_004522, partial [Coemansia aciculifera]
MSALFGSEPGPIDYLCCDIFVQASTDNGEWQVIADPGVLQAWAAKLFAYFYEKSKDFVWNREPLVLAANLKGK